MSVNLGLETWNQVQLWTFEAEKWFEEDAMVSRMGEEPSLWDGTTSLHRVHICVEWLKNKD